MQVVRGSQPPLFDWQRSTAMQLRFAASNETSEGKGHTQSGGRERECTRRERVAAAVVACAWVVGVMGASRSCAAVAARTGSAGVAANRVGARCQEITVAVGGKPSTRQCQRSPHLAGARVASRGRATCLRAGRVDAFRERVASAVVQLRTRRCPCTRSRRRRCSRSGRIRR